MKRPTTDSRASYTAAEAIPIKLFLNEGISELRPVHAQWIPTNRCNLRCVFCSCSKRDRNLQMEMATARKIIGDLAALGCLAVTITGGGEPLCHPDLAEMIRAFDSNGIAVGLVTNGLLLDGLDGDALSLVTWCRISNGDDRELTAYYHGILERAVATSLDWAFSHVVSREPNLEEIRRIVEFATAHDFTHVRLVADLLDTAHVDLGPVRKSLAGIDGRVIYQSRQNAEPGGECLVGYVKPLIGPDYKCWPCCGVQYAFSPMVRDLPESMIVGDARELHKMYAELKPWRFNCQTCYYMAYNRVLSALTSNIQHREFV